MELDKAEYEMITVEQKNRVTQITFNRPAALNALCAQLLKELIHCAKNAEKNENCGAIVITGSEKAFCAGADIKEMKDLNFVAAYTNGLLEDTFKAFNCIKTPIIAAVNGFALGGGLELALACDIVYCGKGAKFGQVEIKVGTIPGCGGSQRLIREVGKSRAMEMSQTGDFLLADEALSRGLAAKVFEPAELVEKAVELGNKIGSFSKATGSMVKDVVNKAYELPLNNGLDYERKMFWATFSSEDQKEGMNAMCEKRKPQWKHA